MKKTNLILPVLTRKNAFRCGVVALALVTMTGCKDDVPGENGGNQPEQPELTTDSYTVKTSDANRVRNYAALNSRASDDFTMPDCPEIPAEALDLNAEDEWGGKPNLNYGSPRPGVYYVKAGDTISQGLNLNNNTIYVAGRLEMSYMNHVEDTHSTFYVLEGGELAFNSAIVPGTTIYNWGDLDLETLTVGDNAKVYSNTDIICETFGVNDNGEFFSKGSVSGDNIRLNGTVRACSFIAKNGIEVNNGGTFHTSYFKAQNLTMNGGNIYIDNNGLIDVETATVTNEHTRMYVDGDNAVFTAQKYITNNKTWAQFTIAPQFNVVFNKVYIGNDEVAINELELQGSKTNLENAEDFGVPAGECHPAWGKVPEETPDPIIIIEKITDIDPLEPDHDHGTISATCITFDGNKAYASYHLRGEGQKGCIEVMEPADNGVKLLSYMISPDYDFNHLIVDEGKIITVGNHTKKGAFIASLPVGFEASETVREDLKVKELTTDEVLMVPGKDDEIKGGYKNAGDGNCVIRHGNNYYVNTYRGYGALNLDFSKVEGSFVPTNGSSKHIDIANGKAAIISLDTYNTTESASTVNVYNADDKMFTTILDTYAAGTISPIDGKNVIAIDGENIYACLGKGGLVRLNDNASFHAGENGKVPANGMAIDDKYIYAAMGSFVFVLNKTDLSEVTHYHASSLKSANYIALHDGLIYVAFGEDGIQVFRLVAK